MSEETPEPDRIPGAPHPRDTARLFGQEAAERAFLDAWRADRLHHAWLLRGPEGVGKATLAYRIARALIAAPAPGGGGLFGAPDPADSVPDSLDPPEGCPVMARIRSGGEPRLSVLRRGVNERGRLYTQIRIDEVRAVKRFLALSSADGGWRAVIVDPAEEMNTAAQNALLKVLEEPPAQTVMLLVSHAPARLLPTIRSRCRTLDLGPLGAENLAAALAATGEEVSGTDRARLAELSAGSVGGSLRLLSEDGLDLYAKVVAALSGPDGLDRAAMVALAESVAARGAERRYALALELVLMLAGRLARHAAGMEIGEAAPGELRLAERLARHPGQARHWAEAVGRIAPLASHARAVNLDPAQTMMDTLLDLDETLARAREAA